MLSWHFSVVGLNADILFFRIFHETFGLFPAFWSKKNFVKKSFWVKTSPLFARVAVMTFMRINNFESFLRIATHYMCIYINTWFSVFQSNTPICAAVL